MCQLTGEQYWVVPYNAINLDGVNIKIRESARLGRSRHELGVGETVGFLDHEQQQRQGQFLRLNYKTVTLVSDGQKWRVSYNYLHHVFDSGELQHRLSTSSGGWAGRLQSNLQNPDTDFAKVDSVTSMPSSNLHWQENL